jgi:hypothetical protein
MAPPPGAEFRAGPVVAVTLRTRDSGDVDRCTIASHELASVELGPRSPFHYCAERPSISSAGRDGRPAPSCTAWSTGSALEKDPRPNSTATSRRVSPRPGDPDGRRRAASLVLGGSRSVSEPMCDLAGADGSMRAGVVAGGGDTFGRAARASSPRSGERARVSNSRLQVDPPLRSGADASLPRGHRSSPKRGRQIPRVWDGGRPVERDRHPDPSHGVA